MNESSTMILDKKVLSRHESTPAILPIIGIGASAGGLEAVKKIFGKMPADTGMAFVLIPHKDPEHRSPMVEIIRRHTIMPVVQVNAPTKIAPNHIYIVSPNRNLAVQGEDLVPCDIFRDRGINLPVDYFIGVTDFFREKQSSAADSCVELCDTWENLQNTIEALKASNGEMMSINEELQSSNKELQSMNEALNTVNAELMEKVDALQAANNDLSNLMNSTDVATLFLDVNFAVRRFTPAAKQLFNLIPTDVGRPIGDLARRFADEDLNRHAIQVMETLTPCAKEVQTDEGRWYIRRILPFRTMDNHLDGLVLTFSDVTELKRREVELKVSQSRLSAAVAISGVGIYEHCIPIGSELFHSDRWAEMLGYTIEELPPHDQFMAWLMKRIHPEDVTAIEKAYSDFIEGRTEEYNVEVRMRKKNGEWIQVQCLGRAKARDAAGRVTQVICVTLDVTPFRRVQAELRKNERRFRAIFDTGLFGIALTLPDMHTIEVNDTLCKMLGYTREELLGPSWEKVTHPDDIRLDYGHFQRLLAGETKGYTIEKRYIRKDGEQLYADLYVNSVCKDDGTLQSIVGLVDDITKRKQAEDRLTLLTESVNASLAGFDIVDENRRFVYVNKAYLDMWGYDSAEEVLGTSPETHCTDKEMIGNIITQVSEEGSGTFEFEAKRRDGSLFDVLMRVSLLTNADGRRFYHGFSIDISDRKRMERALRSSERKFKNIAENIPGMVLKYRMGPNGENQVVYISRGVEGLYEISREDVKKNVSLLWDCVHREDLPAHAASIKESLQKNILWEREYRIVLPDGTVKWIFGRGVPNRQGDGSVIWDALGIDITAQKKSEQALQKALAEKEVLLREVHHRVKNNMQIIVGLLRMQARRVRNAQLSNIFDDCRNRIEAMSLIHETLYRSEDLRNIDYEAYLKKLCRNLGLVNNATEKGILLTLGRCDVAMNMDQGIAVGMVVTELVSNAFKHAFPGNQGGRVQVDLTELDSDTVELIVKDDGVGLSAEIDLQDLPSLGLRLAVNIVTHELGGSLKVERAGGTRFVIRFKCERT